MLQFQKVSIGDRDRLLPLLLEKDRGCEYTFSNIYLYRNIFDTKIAYYKDSAVVTFGNSGSFLMPLGQCDLTELVAEFPSEDGDTIRFVCVPKEETELLKSTFGGRVISVTAQDDPEYVYRSSDLATLSGKRYHSKRNFCTRFEKQNPGYTFEMITEDNIADVAAMNSAWYVERRGSGDDLSEDYICSTGSLKEFKELGLTGALIRSNGRVVAWCCGEKNAEGVFCTHVEKALGTSDGDYAIINRDFARMLSAEYELINREDDAGDEGLRKAKQSYHPLYMLEKNLVVLKK